MSQYIFIGDTLSVPALRDYIITHKVNAGDTIVLNSQDFAAIVQEMKTATGEIPDFPVKLLEVILAKETTDAVPVGKIQIVKNEQTYL